MAFGVCPFVSLAKKGSTRIHPHDCRLSLKRAGRPRLTTSSEMSVTLAGAHFSLRRPLNEESNKRPTDTLARARPEQQIYCRKQITGGHQGFCKPSTQCFNPANTQCFNPARFHSLKQKWWKGLYLQSTQITRLSKIKI